MCWLAMSLLAIPIMVVFTAVIRKRLDVIAVPFFLAAIMGYLYILLPARAILNGNLWQHVTSRQATWAILFPVIALAAFCIGWFARGERGPHVPGGRHFRGALTCPSPNVLYRSGVLLGVVGMGLWGYFLVFSGGIRAFYGAVHGQAGRWTDTTAYVYGGILLNFPALALMVIALVRSGTRSKAKWGLCAILFAAMFLHAMLMTARGAFFQLTVTTATAYMLVSRKRIRPSTAFSALLAGGVVLAVLVGYREAIFLGTSTEKFREVEFVDATSGEGCGNEFVYHTGVLATVDHVQHYGYGERYFWLLVLQPIPRQLWPSKPPMGAARTGISADDFAHVMGWSVAVGAACGLVADWYLDWGFFSIIAWCLLGYLFCLLYQSATSAHASPMAMVLYALVLGRTLHLFSQGSIAFLVNMLITGAGMYIACWICSLCAGLPAATWYPYGGMRPHQFS